MMNFNLLSAGYFYTQTLLSFLLAAVNLLGTVWSFHAFKLYYIGIRTVFSLRPILTHYWGNTLQRTLPSSPWIMTLPTMFSRKRNYFQSCVNPGDYSFHPFSPCEWFSLAIDKFHTCICWSVLSWRHEGNPLRFLYHFLFSKTLHLASQTLSSVSLEKLLDFYWVSSPCAVTWKPSLWSTQLWDYTFYPHLLATIVQHHLMPDNVETYFM